MIAVLDADVLFPMILRDTLLRVAAAGGFRAHWSDRILEEMTHNLVDQHRADEAQARRLVETMASAFPDARVEGWERHEAAMRNHPKDRHVAAAAQEIGATAIVTSNLKDFAELPAGIVAQSPDAFLLTVFEEAPDLVVGAMTKQAASYRKPAMDLLELLDTLAKPVPGFARAVCARLAAR